MSTFNQIYIHIVFSVKNREPHISKIWRDQLYKYIIAIIQKHKHKVLAIGGTDDHIHIFINYNLNQTIPSLMLEVKRDSSKWINENRFVGCGFEWQEGYGVFSCGKSQMDDVIKYIHGQEEKHLNKSSFDEYKEILVKYEIDFNEKYVK